MAKITLQQQLTGALADKEYFKGKAEARSEEISRLKDRIAEMDLQVRGSINAQVELSRHLFEIVRWQANPETTKFPFRAEKEQRDDQRFGPLNY